MANTPHIQCPGCTVPTLLSTGHLFIVQYSVRSENRTLEIHNRFNQEYPIASGLECDQMPLSLRKGLCVRVCVGVCMCVGAQFAVVQNNFYS